MKKVLSLVLAAAMALGVTATAFAVDAQKYDKNTVFDTTSTGPKTAADLAPNTGDKWISNLERTDGKTGTTLDALDDVELKYTFVGTGNKEYNGTHYVNKIRVGNYEPAISIKGPAEVTKSKIDRNTFTTWEDGDHIYVAFDVIFTMKATNEDATKYKGLVITYGAKTVSVPTRSGLKGKTDAKNTEWEAGYSDIDEDGVYDQAVQGLEDMNDYDEDSFEILLKDNPVIPASVIRYLQKNLSNNKSVIFYNDDESVYFDSSKTLELTGKAIKEFSSNANANIKVNDNAIDEIKDVLDEADVDNTWFNYVVHRNIEGTHSFDSGYNHPHVYLVNEDGSLTEVDVKSYDYGDVAFEGPMGQYVVTEGAIPEELFDADANTDEPIEDDDLINEPVEDDDNLVDEDGNPIENNPGTGSSNAISLAVAMAVVSLAAAGLVASKKASK
ncbi:MAG: acid shock protein [Oscillospiraceae bacterium]|jgi:hypothetical protein|nr:acid shock protein [Oscillospiraceae bacterium]